MEILVERHQDFKVTEPIYKNTNLIDLPNEKWIEVKDFEGHYEVSNLGRIKSLERKIPFKGGFLKIKEKIRKQFLCKSKGNLSVTLSLDGSMKTCQISIIVYFSFNKNKYYLNKKYCVQHKNKILTDNKIENLELTSVSKSHTNNFNHGLLQHLKENRKIRTLKLKHRTHIICSSCKEKKKKEEFSNRYCTCIECRKIKAKERYSNKLKKQGKVRKSIIITIEDTVTKEKTHHTNKQNCIISSKLINKYANTNKLVKPYNNSKHKNPLKITTTIKY